MQCHETLSQRVPDSYCDRTPSCPHVKTGTWTGAPGGGSRGGRRRTSGAANLSEGGGVPIFAPSLAVSAGRGFDDGCLNAFLAAALLRLVRDAVSGCVALAPYTSLQFVEDNFSHHHKASHRIARNAVAFPSTTQSRGLAFPKLAACVN